MIPILLARKIAELFIMMFMGYLLVTKDMIKRQEIQGFSIVMLYLVLPIVIVNCFLIENTYEVRAGLLIALIVAIVIHTILIGTIHGLSKLYPFDSVEKTSIIYSNASNLIVPIVITILGPEWVVYSTPFLAVQLALLWSHGRRSLSPTFQIRLQPIITNMNIIAIILGFFMFMTDLRFPSIIANTFNSVAAMIGPLGMLITGMLLGFVDIKKALQQGRIYIVVAMRLLVMPLIIMAFMKIFRLESMLAQGSTILLVSFLSTMTPSASTVSQMAQIYGKDAEYASMINALSTIFCIATMPVLVYLFQWL